MMILLTKKEGAAKKRFNWRFARQDINIIKTGMDREALDLLIDIYIKSEIGGNNGK